MNALGRDGISKAIAAEAREACHVAQRRIWCAKKDGMTRYRFQNDTEILTTEWMVSDVAEDGYFIVGKHWHECLK